MAPLLPWWQQGVLYQIYPRSFQDSNGDGVGDLQGIRKRLDYLQWLGVDAFWISPFYPSPMVDFGYDIADYTNIDPLFGDLTNFDQLLREAHERHLKVIIDFVPNHTSDQHPWFLESRASRTNPKRSWYVWADPKPDGSPPNNWLSIAGGASWAAIISSRIQEAYAAHPRVAAGSSWEWDATTEQYYLHSFFKEQPDLNWRNPLVKATLFDVVCFWLERGVDGFRIDAASFIAKDPEMRDNPPNPRSGPLYHRPFGAYDTQLHIHDRGHPDVHGILRDLRSLLESYSRSTPRVAIGELSIFTWQEWASYYGAPLDELHLPSNFSLLGVAWNAQAVRQAIEACEAVVPEGAWPNYVLGNHDEARFASRVGPQQARVGMMLLLTSRGTPTLYYGDELGMHNVEIPSELCQDVVCQSKCPNRAAYG